MTKIRYGIQRGELVHGSEHIVTVYVREINFIKSNYISNKVTRLEIAKKL